MKEKKMDFCIECRKDTEYRLQKKIIERTIREKVYQIAVTTAICAECGEEMSLPGFIDKNIQEIDAQYRAEEGLVSKSDIENLIHLYNIGKAPLSLALGFGEVTITRYLAGQVPSREYSDIIKSALTSPAYMKRLLDQHKEKISAAAYHKAMSSAQSLEELFSVSAKMLRVIYEVFLRLEEVTPLMLQKLLYFIQGVHSALYNRPMYAEDCEAWVHGPVYPKVYHLFKDFKYNPIDDARFAVLDSDAEVLTEEERNVIDLVVNTFGIYGGKVLERITHNEAPWKEARKGYEDGIPSHETITKESISVYFHQINAKYHLADEDGLNRYIQDMLNRK